MIARIQISVEAPYEIEAEGGYALYLTNSKKMKEPDKNKNLQVYYDWEAAQEKYGPCACYEIRMVEDAAFSVTTGTILFQNEMNLYVEEKNGEVLHYFHIPFTRSIAAWCEAPDKHSLMIHYRPAHRDYFRDAVGCFNAAAFENILYTYEKFLFHCSYVDAGGEAVLFSADSGGGKTTHALLWEQSGLGEMINGDRAVLEKVECDEFDADEKRHGDKKPGYIVHGLPIAGSSNVFKNRSLPLRAVFMLEKAPVNEVVELSPSKRFLRIIEQITIHTWDREFVSSATDFVSELVQNIPVKLLRCRPDEGAVQAVRQALSDDLR